MTCFIYKPQFKSFSTKFNSFFQFEYIFLVYIQFSDKVSICIMNKAQNKN